MARTFLKGKAASLNDYARYDVGVGLDVTYEEASMGTATVTMYPDKIIVHFDTITASKYFTFDAPVDIRILDGYTAHSSATVSTVEVSVGSDSLTTVSIAASAESSKIGRFYTFDTEYWDADCGDTIKIANGAAEFTGYLILSIMRK